MPWSAFESNVNGNDHQHSAAGHLKDGKSRLRQLELSLQDAISMVHV